MTFVLVIKLLRIYSSKSIDLIIDYQRYSAFHNPPTLQNS